MAGRVGWAVAIAALAVGLSAGAGSASPVPGAKAAPSPVVWFLSIESRLGRVQSGSKLTIFDNPLHCARGDDDCNLQGLAATHGALWVPDQNNGLREIDPATGKAANSINDDRYSSNPVVWDGRLWFTAVDHFLAVSPPATGTTTRGAILGAEVEDLAPSDHFLWAGGSGSGRNDPAAVVRVDRSGHVGQRFTIPVPGEVAPLIAALNDRTAYVVLSPDSGATNAPSELFRLTVTASGGSQVDDLGAMTFAPGGIVAVDGHLWLNDSNASRLVELDLDGKMVSQVTLSVPGDGQLVSASKRLWYMGSPEPGDPGASVLQVVNPDTGAIESTTSVALPSGDRVGYFTVVG